MTPKNQTVTIHHGGSRFQGCGLQTVHRIHVDAKGVEHIYVNKRWTPLANVQNIVRRNSPRVPRGIAR